MRWIKLWFAENFGYGKKELNGSIALLVLIVAGFLGSYGYDQYQYISHGYPQESDLKLLEEWTREVEWRRTDPVEVPEKKETYLASAGFSAFDPNNVSEQQLLAMGLPKYLAANWGKYLEKGGRFRRKEDLLKLYGFDSALYDQLEPYLVLSAPVAASKRPDQVEKDIEPVSKAKREINRATAADLQNVRGIGPAFSERIVKYRSRLGGFARKSQLGEVYGLDAATIEALWTEFDLDSTSCCERRSLNQVIYDSLRRHPYLNYNQAKAIVAYRQQHGAFSGWHDVAEIKIIPDTVIEKLKPYFDF